MIYITKASSNTVALTLWEKTTIALDLVQYLFIFDNAQTNETTAFIAEDTSDFINRYNLFTIVENDNPDPLAGEVSLDRGRYNYYVYEQESTTNLDPTGLTLVESGFVTVYAARAADTTYATSATQYEVYNGGK